MKDFILTFAALVFTVCGAVLGVAGTMTIVGIPVSEESVAFTVFITLAAMIIYGVAK